MNSKIKKILLVLIFLCSLFYFQYNVFAADSKTCKKSSYACLKCVYTYKSGINTYTYSVTVKSKQNSEFEIKEECEVDDKREYVKCGEREPSVTLFLDGNDRNYLKCPNNAYFIPGKDIYDPDILSYYRDETNGISMKLSEKNSENNRKKIYNESKTNQNGDVSTIDDNSSNVYNSGLTEWKQKKCSELSDVNCKKRQDCQMVGGTCSDAEIAKEPCNENSIRQVLKFFGYLLMIAKFVVPFIVIGFAVFDLYKSIIEKDEKALKTKIRMIMFRIIAGVTVFFIPDLVWVGFKYIDKSNITDSEYQTCAECILKPGANELCTLQDNSTNE